MQTVHKPVLLNEVVASLADASSLNNKDDHWYLDGTFGGGGHAKAMLEKLNGKLNIIGFDRDPEAVERGIHLLNESRNHLGCADDYKTIIEEANYRDLDKILAKHVIGKVDMILLDLGISSDELDNSGRGFTFLKDEPLLMTMGDPKKYPFTARDIVNNWSLEDIANVIFGYGEERYARRIARAIIERRESAPIETTFALAQLIERVVPKFGFGKRKIHPATKTFQALRIAVNDELGALKEGLAKGYESLKIGGRMAVISFHSLEDRIVKEFMKEKKVAGAVNLISKKPIVATQEEEVQNPRSRSAKLRVMEKVA